VRKLLENLDKRGVAIYLLKRAGWPVWDQEPARHEPAQTLTPEQYAKYCATGRLPGRPRTTGR
jgi:hypothetical protein